MKTIQSLKPIAILGLLAGLMLALPACESQPAAGTMLFAPEPNDVVKPAPAAKAEPKRAPAAPKPQTRDYVILKLQWQPQAQFAGYIMALEKGFFQEAGVGSIQLQWFSPGDTTSPLNDVATGKIDFCTAWLSDAVYCRQQGKPVMLLAQVMDKSAMMLVTRKDTDIKSPADMNNRRVGIWGGDFAIPPKAFFHKYRVKPILIQQTNSIQPFLRGSLPIASAMYYNEYHSLMESGLKADDLRTFSFSDYGLDFPEDGLYCSVVTRQRKPGLCTAINKAVRQGWAYAFENESETLRTVMHYCRKHKINTNMNHQRWMLRAMKKFIHPSDNDQPWGDLPENKYNKVIEILRQQAIIKAAPDYRSFFKPV